MALSTRTLLTTLTIYYIFLQLGLRFALLGPTMLDLQANLSISYAQMSNAFSVMCIGICLGALLTGLLSKLLTSRELLTFLLMLGTSGLVAAYTYTLDYRYFIAVNLAVGVTSGAAIATSEAWVLELWGKDCGPWMQALQFFRGLGYILAPILADPFLSAEDGEAPTTSFSNSTKAPPTNMSSLNSTTPTTPLPLEPSRPFNSALHTPYLVNAGLFLLGAILLLALYLFNLCKRFCTGRFNLSKGPSEVTIISQSTNSINTITSTRMQSQPSVESSTSETRTSTQSSSNSPYFTLTIIIIGSVFYLFFYEEVIVTYLPSYCTQIEVQLTKSEASFLTSVFNLANLIGKALGILLALKMTHLKMLYLNLGITATSLTVLIFYADTNRVILWVGVCVLGVGLSSIIASLYTLLEDTVRMSPLMCGILNMAGTTGSVITPLIIGPYMETMPGILMWISLLYTAVCTVLVGVMDVLLRWKQATGKRIGVKKM